MNKNGLYMGFMITGILVVLIYASYGMLNLGKEKPYYSVSVIVEDSSNDRWNAFKEGLEQGASENHIYLNIVSTTEIADYKEEWNIIARELENGADGIIIEMCDSADESSNLSSKAEEEAIVLIDTDLEAPSDNEFTVVATNAAKMGAAIAEAVINGEGTEDYTIGVLTGNQKKSSMQQRLQGFLDVIADTDAQIVWSFSEEELENTTLAVAMDQTMPDVIVALENDETERAVDFLLESRESQCRLYGEGRSEKAIYYLGKGMIEALVVADEYSMGYQSITEIAAQLEQMDKTVRNIEVGFVSVTREEMYNEDTERILFPVI
ncbi:MAG: substrate-binding domain-containing protein [Lachnospiraceae bacterium]|nr:substrate-binding domain-containing protein [Lachnospiraceae bacterium]